jgi:hypothetical protein
VIGDVSSGLPGHARRGRARRPVRLEGIEISVEASGGVHGVALKWRCACDPSENSGRPQAPPSALVRKERRAGPRSEARQIAPGVAARITFIAPDKRAAEGGGCAAAFMRFACE